MAITFILAVNLLPMGTYHDWKFTTKAIATYFLGKALYVPDLTFPLLAMLKVGYQELNKQLESCLEQYSNCMSKESDVKRLSEDMSRIQREWVTLRSYCSELSQVLGLVWASNLFVIIFNMSMSLNGFAGSTTVDPYPALDMACSVVTVYALLRLGQGITSEVRFHTCFIDTIVLWNYVCQIKMCFRFLYCLHTESEIG
jgi:hypothetical protein